jgi:hypothetical protein
MAASDDLVVFDTTLRAIPTSRTGENIPFCSAATPKMLLLHPSSSLPGRTAS